MEFNILDENKQIIYSNLKTNSKGEILLENFLPGKYYIQETNSKDGYLLDERLIEFNIKLNEELTIIIDNLFEKIPEIEKTKDKITQTIINKVPEIEKTKNKITETVVKKLPVTGM